jgi:hypothetical protein
MSDIDDIPWGDPVGDAIQLAKPKPCRHVAKSDRVTKNIAPDGAEPVYAQVCPRCDHVFDPEKQRQGKSSNRIAKDIERWVGKMLRLPRVGQYGGQEDLGKQDDWAFVQVKSGPAWFAERYYNEIVALPQRAGRRRALVVVSKPGSGGRRRALWIELLEEVPMPGTAAMIWQDDATCEVCQATFPDHKEWCVHAVH